MPDAIQPVGAMIKPQDPSQGINTMTGILGLQQARQNLQTGAYQQQTASAGADQAQQQNMELQKARAVALQGAQSGKYTKRDGSLDRQAMADDITRVAPTYGESISGQLLSHANEIVSNKTALQNLNEKQRSQIGTTLGALALKPDLSHSDVIDTLAQLADQNPALTRMTISAGASLPADAKPDDLRAFVRRAAVSATSPDSAAAQTAPQVSTMQGPGGLQAINTNPQAPGGVRPVGAPLPQGLAPTEQLPYVRSRGAAGVEGTAGAQNDEALYNNIVQSGTKSAQIKSLSEDVRNLSKEVQTGQYSKAFADKWSALAQTFGYKPGDDSPTTRRQILSKMAAQLKLQSEAGAPTDSARAGIEAAMPDPEHMDPAAVAQAARYVGAQSDVNAARAQFANQHRQVNGGTSTGLRDADSSFMKNADPRVFEYQNIPAGKERQDYAKQHFKSKEEFKAFLDKIQTMRGYGAVQ